MTRTMFNGRSVATATGGEEEGADGPGAGRPEPQVLARRRAVPRRAMRTSFGETSGSLEMDNARKSGYGTRRPGPVVFGSGGLYAKSPDRDTVSAVAAPFFFLCYSAAFALVFGVERGGGALLAPVLLVFGALPLLDEMIRDDRTPAAASETRALYDLPLLLFVPVQLGLLAYVCARAASFSTNLWALAALALSSGVVTGSCGITIAHELMHRREQVHRSLAEILMSSVGYGHFTTEHVFGHHRFVGTPRDPATARLGESFYAFLPRTVLEGIRSGFGLEGARLSARGGRAWSWHDGRLRWTALSLAFALTATALGGGFGLLVWISQAAVAIVLLELINYLEHYGLERRIDEQGRPERVRLAHSWNSARRVSGLFLFRLTRHSEHHFDASRPYERLPPGALAPELPAGYASMLLVALVPSLWFRVMDPRAKALRKS
jgi:alkane 1-monooxygenase